MESAEEEESKAVAALPETETAGEDAAGESEMMRLLPRQRMTFRKVAELCVPDAKDDADAVADKLLDLKVARLEWQGFTAIENLDAMTSIRDLYLQRNRIRVIENLDFHQRLRFLVLSHNLVERISGLVHLGNLELLDLSNNRIDVLEEAGLPEGLRNLDLASNPCTREADYEERLRKRLPGLVILDGRVVATASAEEEENGSADGQAGMGARVASQQELLDRSQRTDKRPTSALGRSDAMLEAATRTIDSLCSSTRVSARASFAERRKAIRERSTMRMAEQDAAFRDRVKPTVDNTRGKPAAAASNVRNE